MRRSSRSALVGLLLSSALVPVEAVPAQATTCQPWTARTVATGLGTSESVLADGTGGMLVSTGSAVIRVLPDGTSTTVTSAASPGQLVHVGSEVWLPTGDAAQSGVLGTADGTLRTLAGTTLATGLTMPNGLAVSTTGDAYVTRDLGTGTGITRIHSTTVTPSWAADDDTNGIAIDDARGVMWVDHTFTASATVDEISLRDSTRVTQVGDLTQVGSPVPKGLDGLIRVGTTLFIAANLSGEVLSFDTVTHAACVIASGFMNTSAVAVGAGPGWRSDALFAVGFDGVLHELDPPTAPAGASPSMAPSPSAAAPSPVRRHRATAVAAPARSLAATGGLPLLPVAVLCTVAGAWALRRLKEARAQPAT